MKLSKKVVNSLLVSAMVLTPLACVSETTYASTSEDRNQAVNDALKNSETATELGNSARQESATVQNNINEDTQKLEQSIKDQFDGIKDKQEAQGGVDFAQDTFDKANDQVSLDKSLNDVIHDYNERKKANEDEINKLKNAENMANKMVINSQKSSIAISHIARKRIVSYLEKIIDTIQSPDIPDDKDKDKDKDNRSRKLKTIFYILKIQEIHEKVSGYHQNHNQLIDSHNKILEKIDNAEAEFKQATEIYNQIGTQITNKRNALIKQLNVAGYNLAPNATAEQIKEAARQNLYMAHHTLDEAEKNLLQLQTRSKPITNQLLSDIDHQKGIDDAAKLADVFAQLGQTRADATARLIISGSEDHKGAQTPTNPEKPYIHVDETVVPMDKDDKISNPEETKPSTETTVKPDEKTPTSKHVEGKKIIGNLNQNNKNYVGKHEVKSTLPQTGEVNTFGMTLAGIALSLSSLFGLGKLNKKRN